MNREAIHKGLEPTALTHERVMALNESGLDAVDIAEAIGVKSLATISNWAKEKVKPRAKAAETLDDIRYAMGKLVLAGLEPDEAANWMKSRTAEPPYPRPIEIIRDEPEKVFKIIEDSFSHQAAAS